MAILENEELRFLELLEMATSRGDERGELVALEGLAEIEKAREMTSGPSAAQVAGGISPLSNIETLASIASSIIAEPVAGVAGIAGTLIPGDEGQGARFIEKTREALTYQPRTEYGQAGLETVGGVLGPVGEVVGAVGEGIGSAQAAAAEFAGLPEEVQAFYYSTGKALPAAVAEYAGAKGLRAVPGVGREVGSAPPRLPQRQSRQQAARMIEEGQFDRPTAQFELTEPSRTGAPRVERVPEYSEAVRQGFDESVIAMLKEGSPSDVAAMQRMVKVREAQKQNALTNARATDIAGDSLAGRVNYVIAANKDAGRRLDDVAKGLKGKDVDVSSAVDEFISDLEGMGIRLDGNMRPVFDGSDIEGLAGVERVVSNIVQRMKRGGKPDAYDAHRLKRFIDEQVTYGKTQEGMSGRVESVLKSLRRNIDTKLDESFLQYNDVNTQYADTIGALDDIQTALGSKIDLDSARSSKAMGTRLRALWSNQQGRIPMEDAIDNIDSVASKYGGSFDTNVRVLSRFAQELDRVFGSEAPTSLKGQVAESVDIPKSITDIGLGVGREAYKKARGINEQNQFKAISSALNRRSQAQ